VTRRALAAATRWVGARPDMWAISLAGFLVRGGILVLAIPILILPTPIGVASFVGADAVTAAGPTDLFLLVAAVVGSVVAAAIAAGFVIGAAVDRVVLRAWVADGRRDAPASGMFAGVARVVAVRLTAAVPFVVAAAWAVPRIATAGYRELTLPDDLATPFPLRVLAAAPEAAVALLLGLLLCELIAGLATVHLVVDGSSVPRSLWRVVPYLVRRPVPTLATFIAGVAGLLLLLGVPLVVATAAWGMARDAFAGGDPVPAIVAVATLSATWVAGLCLAGAASAWRRAALASAVARPEVAPIRVARRSEAVAG
jgi:hypothetical protein